MNVKQTAVTGVLLALTVSGSIGAQAETAAASRSQNPITRYDQKVCTATQQLSAALGISQREYQLQNELATLEEQIGMKDALHNLTVARWSAIKVFAESSRDPQRRAELVQSINVANAQYNQQIYQALQVGTQTMSQQWSMLTQARGTAQAMFGQAVGEAQSAFGQTMSAYEGAVRTPDILDCTSDLLGQEQQPGSAADQAFAKGVNQARANYQAAIAQADAKWRTDVKSASARVGSGPVDQGEFRKVNRDWLTAAQDALDDIRSGFKSAIRKYRAAIVE